MSARILFAIGCVIAATCTDALKVSVIHDNVCNENGFNQMACKGAQAMQDWYTQDEIEDALINVADCDSWIAANASSHHIVVFIGFQYEACALKASQDHPGTWMVPVDTCPGGAPSNMMCATYAEDQPSFVGGYLAGLVAKKSTGVVGIVGGIPVPGVQRLFNGFIMGVKDSCPTCHIEGTYINSFFHPANAAGVASYLVNDLNAAVVYGCGGGTGSQAILKAADLGSYVIGVDTDEYVYTFGGSDAVVKARVLSSVLKKVDRAVELAVHLLRDLSAGSAIPGVSGGALLLDYQNGGVGMALCHDTCGAIGTTDWNSMLSVEKALAARTKIVGLAVPWMVPVLPVDTAPNTFKVVPEISEPPAPRVQAAIATFNAFLMMDFIAVFGGSDLTNTYDDLWLYNTASTKWLHSSHGMTSGPSPPKLAKSCAVGIGLSVFIFGGKSDTGTRSNSVYSYTYQDTRGFANPLDPTIQQTWAAPGNIGSVPLAVEGPGCAAFNGSCAIVFGGRAELSEVQTVHRFCVSASSVIWEDISPGGSSPPAREGPGVAIVDASAVGLPGITHSQTLVVAGGVGAGTALSDVWLLPLDGASAWINLGSLPDAGNFARSAPQIFATDSPVGSSTTHTLVIQGTSPPFPAFIYDPSQQSWNTQDAQFGSESLSAIEGASMIKAGSFMWLFGGQSGSAYQNSMLASSFALQTKCPPGEQTVGVGCEPCLAGYYSEGSTSGLSAVCTKCKAGRFSTANGTVACKFCQAGDYSNNDGTTSCKTCASGRYSDTSGATTCYNCSVATYQADTGRSACQRCDIGTYSDSIGSTQCKSCDAHLVGGITPFMGANSPSDCTCAAGSYEQLGGIGCIVCSKGLNCPGGREIPTQQKRYYAEVVDATTRRYKVFECAVEDWCPEGPLESCDDKRTNRACAVVEGKACPVYFFLAFPLIALILYVCYRVTVNAEYGKVSAWVMLAGNVGIALNAMQAVNVYLLLFEELPKELHWLLTFAEFFMFKWQGFMPECNMGQTLSARLSVSILPPLLVAGLSACNWMITNGLNKMVTKIPVMKYSATWNCVGMLIQVMYIMQCKDAFSYFASRPNPCGEDTLQDFSDIILWSDEHVAAGPLLITFYLWLFYVIGTYTVFIYTVLTAASKVGNPQFWLKWKFIFGRWRPECRHWGLLLLGRNLLIALIPICIRTDQLYRVLAFVGLLTAHAIFEVRYMPWLTRMNNVFEVLVSMILVAMGVVGLAFHESASEGEKQRASFIMIFLMFCVWVSLFFALVYALRWGSSANVKRRCADNQNVANMLLEKGAGVLELIHSDSDAEVRWTAFAKNVSSYDKAALDTTLFLMNTFENLDPFRRKMQSRFMKELREEKTKEVSANAEA